MRSENNSDRMGIRASLDSPDFVLEFDTTHEEFQRGFECGEIWACLTDGVLEIQSIITASNSEMVMRMADATGYSFTGRYLTSEEIEKLQVGFGDWMIVVMRINNGESAE